MTYWIPPEIAEEAAGAWSPLSTASGTTEDSGWTNWQARMKAYQDGVNSAGLDKLSFWLAVAFPSDNYSEKITWHKEVPMLVPTPGAGRLLGIAKDEVQLSKMLSEDSDNVHLIYKVKLQGQKSWMTLLEFLASHDMLEKEN